MTTISLRPDAASVATDVATDLLDLLADIQAAGGVPQIVLTGGTIADAVHREVARLAPESGVDWSAVVVWWGDERFVAADSPDRNARQAWLALLETVPIAAHNVHEAPAAGTVESVDEAAMAYAAELADVGPDTFDLVMLGVGPDGHVASLFPGQPTLQATDSVVAVTDSPKPPPQRVTMTFDRLNRSDRVWFLVSGAAKADAVASALAGADVADIPANGISAMAASGRPGDVTWWIDQDAASAL